MAFTDTEKAQIVFQLGWPARTIISGSTDYSKIFSDRLNGLGDANEAICRKLLSRLNAIDEKHQGATCRQSAQRVDSIETNPDEIRMLRKEKIGVLRELSDLLNLEIMRKGSGASVGICV